MTPQARPVQDDEGSMLVELIVGMLLMSIIGVMVLDGIVGGFRSQRTLQNRSEALAAVRTTAQRVTREIREAAPVQYATATTLTLDHPTNTGAIVRKTWTLDTTAKSLTVTTATVTNGVAGTGTTTTVVTNLDTTTLPFTYNPVPQWVAPTGSSVDSSTCAISGTSPVVYDKYCIGKVTLHLSRTTSGKTPVGVDATVDLRNRES